jgi:glycosyltransferase involved in cell wall biosynthesis
VRVLLVTDKPVRGGGGVGSHVTALASELVARGHAVERLSLVPGDAGAGGHRMAPSQGRVQAWLQRGALARAIAATRPDVVHVQSTFTTLASPLLARLSEDVPTVATLHDARPFCFLATRRFGPGGAACTRRRGVGCVTSGCVRPAGAAEWLRALRRVAVEASALRVWQGLPAVVVPSRYLAELAAQHGFARERLHVIPPFVADSGIEREPADPPRIAFVGRLVAGKGADVALEAMTRLGGRRFEAVWIGDGPERTALEARARAAAVPARFTGWLDPDARDAELAAAAFLVFPSQLPESFGLVGVEAGRLGRPAVGFGTGGTPEWLIDGETGLVARDESAEELAVAMARLLDDPIVCRSLGARARARAAERFSPAPSVEAVIALYEGARAGRAAR